MVGKAQRFQGAVREGHPDLSPNIRTLIVDQDFSSEIQLLHKHSCYVPIKWKVISKDTIVDKNRVY